MSTYIAKFPLNFGERASLYNVNAFPYTSFYVVYTDYYNVTLQTACICVSALESLSPTLKLLLRTFEITETTG